MYTRLKNIIPKKYDYSMDVTFRNYISIQFISTFERQLSKYSQFRLIGSLVNRDSRLSGNNQGNYTNLFRFSNILFNRGSTYVWIKLKLSIRWHCTNPKWYSLIWSNDLPIPVTNRKVKPCVYRLQRYFMQGVPC